MQKHIISAIIFILVATAIGTHQQFLSKTAAAVDELVVQFETTPLFSIQNLLPGDHVHRWARVTNNATSTKAVAVLAANISDPHHLGDVLELAIYSSTTQLYATTTLTTFLNAGEVALGNLAGNGTTTQYDFALRFSPNAGNVFQGKSISFDVIIGFAGTIVTPPPPSPPPSAPPSSPPSPPPSSPSPAPSGGGGSSSGGGGGGGGGILVFLISNESINNITDTTATIRWLTTFPSTSRVIYGTQSQGYSPATPPNFSYPNATAEEDTPPGSNGVTFHDVELTGLVPDTVYYIRAVSSDGASTAFGNQISFRTLARGQRGITGGVGGDQGSNSIAALPPPQSGTGGESAPSSGSIADGGRRGLGGIDGEGTSSPSTSTNESGSGAEIGGGGEDRGILGNFFAGLFGPLPWLPTLLLLIAILIIIWFLYERSRKKDEEQKNQPKPQ